MSQPPETGPLPASPADPETLGQYLRRVRIGNGIDIKKMSADTRLSLETLTAVEKDDYKKIPGSTYQKVFIKNISKYLGLDPEKTYERFIQQSGAHETPVKSQPSGQQKAVEPSPETRPTMGLVMVLAVLAGILILVLLARRGLTSGNSMPAPEALKSPAADTSAVDTGETESLTEDSSSAGEPAPAIERNVQKTSEPTPPAEALPVKKNPFLREKRGTLKVKVTCFKDSCYVQACRNGQPWNNFFRQGNHKTFASDSALYFKIEPLSNVNLSLNGTLLDLTPVGNGAFWVGQHGAEPLPEQEWIRLNGGR